MAGARAIQLVVDRLTQLACGDNHPVSGVVRENIHNLRDGLLALENITADLIKYSIYEDSDVQELIGTIRSQVCQVEDVVDSYVVAASVQRARNPISKAFHQRADYSIGLREAKERIRDAADRVRKLNAEIFPLVVEILQYQAIERIEKEEHVVGPLFNFPTVEEEHVVGLESAAEVVTELLTTGPEQLEVISIVGMLGLGKTTLAKKVFKSSHVGSKYTIMAFVHVSCEYERREVYLSILSSFMQITGEVSKLSDDQLEEYLHQQLEGKQYLVVLDEVWERSDWDKFRDAFPDNKKHCRVLLTTRNQEVAEVANRKNPKSCYKLDFLKEKESQELLSRRVFNQKCYPKVFEKYMTQIAAECAGLPLAIVVIASILVDHPNRVDWWKHVANNVKDYIVRDREQTAKVIKLMYKHLPNYLKACFLYLGVFPKESEIPVWKLVRLWIAEELVQPYGNVNLEEMAEEYLEELVCRNLVIVGQRRSNDKIKTCLLQSTLHEFCTKEAMKENLFHKIKKDKLSSFFFGNPDMDQCRRLCTNNVNVLNYISSASPGKCVRSFLTFNKEETTVKPNHVSSIPKTFKLLKVLESESLIFTRFPVDLRRLVLLKYIAISSNFAVLPAAMSALSQMQTLIINTTFPVLDIKANIWKMPQFRHLHSNVPAHLPSPATKCQTLEGKNVQTLSIISIESCQKEVFDQTPKLKKLSICGTLAMLCEANGESKLFGYLHSLESLENLKLLNDKISIDGLLSERSFPQKLTKLTLSDTQLGWKEMSTISKLANLEVLKLKDNAFLGKTWETEKGGFLHLRNLHIGFTIWRYGKLQLMIFHDSSVSSSVTAISFRVSHRAWQIFSASN